MNVLGLMSGSSLDGLDMALCSFDGIPGDSFTFRTLQCYEVAFPQEISKSLKKSKSLSVQELLKLDAVFGQFLGEECKKFIEASNFNVHLISSHGHTIFHNPEEHYTLQIGDGAILSQIAERNVVCDVRSSDIGAGGAGAPFAPLADFYLYPNSSICINLGGISNISFQKNEKITAFDVSPCNQLLNHIVSRINLNFDDGGQLAAKGKRMESLFLKMKEINSYNNNLPRAIDNSWVEDQFFPLLTDDLDISDLLRTCTDFIVSELTEAISSNIQNVEYKRVLVTGGGALNTFLMSILQERLDEMNLLMEKASLKTIKFKEAILMSLFGYLRVKNIPNAFSSVTGANRNTIGGSLYTY